jgi:VanZ like family
MRVILRPYEPLLPFVPIVLVAASLVGVALGVIRHQRGAALSDSVRTALLDVGLGLWLLVLLIATLPRAGGQGRRSIELVPFGELYYGVESTVVARMVSNVFLFVPLGILAPARWAKVDALVRIALIGGSLSLTIELTQFFIATGRQTSVTDLLLNTTGAMFGYLLTCLWVGQRPRLLTSG